MVCNDQLHCFNSAVIKTFKWDSAELCHICDNCWVTICPLPSPPPGIWTCVFETTALSSHLRGWHQIFLFRSSVVRRFSGVEVFFFLVFSRLLFNDTNVMRKEMKWNEEWEDDKKRGVRWDLTVGCWFETHPRPNWLNVSVWLWVARIGSIIHHVSGFSGWNLNFHSRILPRTDTFFVKNECWILLETLTPAMREHVHLE